MRNHTCMANTRVSFHCFWSVSLVWCISMRTPFLSSGATAVFAPLLALLVLSSTWCTGREQ